MHLFANILSPCVSLSRTHTHTGSVSCRPSHQDWLVAMTNRISWEFTHGDDKELDGGAGGEGGLMASRKEDEEEEEEAEAGWERGWFKKWWEVKQQLCLLPPQLLWCL